MKQQTPSERAREAAAAFTDNKTMTVQGGFSTRDIPTGEEPFPLVRVIERRVYIRREL